MKKTNNPSILQPLTPDVKRIVAGSQLQQFRSFANDKGQWAYELRFYPGPKKHSLLARKAEGSALTLFQAEASEDRQKLHRGLKARVDPVQLYIRAHLLNQKLERDIECLESSEGSNRELRFYFGKGTLSLRQEGVSAEVSIRVQVEGRKDFSRNLALASIEERGLSAESSTQEGAGSPSDASITTKQVKKREKLLESVQRDLSSSQAGLEKLNRICSLLETEPMAWGRRELWPEAVYAELKQFIDRHHWPLFSEETRAAAQQEIFALRRRYERKIQGAQKRLTEVEQQKLQPQMEAQKLHKKKVAGANRFVGRQVYHPSGVMALIGKKQKENADLYRAAHSRDFWFHVRGQGGAHVWVPRGQKGVSGKEKLSAELSRWAAQLAVYNSKARSSQYGFVDMTEKRHLKSVKGQEGALIIRTSETLNVELDDAFFDWLSKDTKAGSKKG